jgi:RimJ/RimL family protein N-acetyltransferase
MTGWKPKQPVRLETARFRLVSLSQREAARRSLAWTEDADFMGGMEAPHGGWLRRRWRRRLPRANDKTNFCIGIIDKADGRLLGIHTVQFGGDVAFIGVMVGDKKWWGQGVVLETRIELLRFLFEEAGAERVWGTPYGRNLPSIYNYQRLGFIYEGAMRQHRKGLAGGRVDMPIFGLMREEWLARQKNRNSTP